MGTEMTFRRFPQSEPAIRASDGFRPDCGTLNDLIGWLG